MRKRWKDHKFNMKFYKGHIDQDNLKFLKQVIDQSGWPTRQKVGKNASTAAWLIAQHAGFDREFQRKVLGLLKRLPKGAVELKHVALLADRLRLSDGKKQIYGTQLNMDLKGGTVVVPPIWQPSTLDKRRGKMGLKPFNEQFNKASRAIRLISENRKRR